MIYDHTKGRGNTSVTLADSGKMYHRLTTSATWSWSCSGASTTPSSGARSSDQTVCAEQVRASKFVFSLASFNLDRTKEELFSDNKLMKRIDQLKVVVDSMRKQLLTTALSWSAYIGPYYSYFKPDSIQAVPKTAGSSSAVPHLKPRNLGALSWQRQKARSIKSFTASYAERQLMGTREANSYEIEMHRKYTQSIAC